MLVLVFVRKMNEFIIPIMVVLQPNAIRIGIAVPPVLPAVYKPR